MIPNEENDLLQMPPNLEALLYELGWFYEHGRHDGGDHKVGEGEFARLFAKLMIATGGGCGGDIASLYNAWQHDVLGDYILKGAPDADQLLRAQAAWQEAR